jgi:hypothetical protein
MHLIPLIATATEDLGHSHSVMDALPHLGGMLMVLITLTMLWGLTALVSKLVAIIIPEIHRRLRHHATPASGRSHRGLAGATPAAWPTPASPRKSSPSSPPPSPPPPADPPHHLHQTHEHQLGKSRPPIRSHLTPNPLTSIIIHGTPPHHR